MARTLTIRMMISKPDGAYSTRDIATHEIKMPAATTPKRVASLVHDALTMMISQMNELDPEVADDTDAPIEQTTSI